MANTTTYTSNVLNDGIGLTDATHQFCNIFVEAPEPQSIARRLAALVEARLQGRTLNLAEAVVEVRTNADAGMTDDFIGWLVTVEIDAMPEAADVAVASLVSPDVEVVQPCDAMGHAIGTMRVRRSTGNIENPDPMTRGNFVRVAP